MAGAAAGCGAIRSHNKHINSNIDKRGDSYACMGKRGFGAFNEGTADEPPRSQYDERGGYEFYG
ncbi:hypothetical protein J14TS5_36000 [Paenibacillus lautus]|nr:hypothetical protein J14TS5_36000 [Paenibacillus lautus]